MGDLSVLNESLKKIDVSLLVKYTKKIKDIGSLSKMQAPLYMQEFIQAIDVVNVMLTSAIKLDIDAKTALNSAESIAYLDKASDFLKEKNIKESDSARKMYVDIDENVLSAKDFKARTEAVVVFLKNQLQIFRMSHDDCKKIGYGDQAATDYTGF